MTESLQVIALISGGKDSFFSLLHCIQNGHQVVALGNLYPATSASAHAPRPPDASNHGTESEDEQDLNSFMYQTVGHTVIPLYEQALGIPLYRQQIVGSAVQTGTSYGFADDGRTGSKSSDLGSAMSGLDVRDEAEDETESLIPLLKRIMLEHPTANALSTGAILSTYQRTRVESVAIRLGLTPLSYLWQYPVLPPGTQISLLEDMQAVGLDARIVKVASGGLNEKFLWQNVADQKVMRRIETSMKRFGTDGDGAVLGEGGEFETLVINGPSSLFKGRIVVDQDYRKVVREGGGSAWLKILKVKVVMKSPETAEKIRCRNPELLASRFTDILIALNKDNREELSLKSQSLFTSSRPSSLRSLSTPAEQVHSHNILHWNVTARQPNANEPITIHASKAITEIRQRLRQESLQPCDIISTVIILRSMDDFASINKVYGTLFTKPNPPSRVTISCGTLLPPHLSLMIHLAVSNTPSSQATRKSLHVQSRSYWAPANIGPYSQARSITLPSSSPPTSLVSIAGQIPLIPHTMNLPLSVSTSPSTPPRNQHDQDFALQAVLSLQHLVRIAREMHVSWLSSCVAYLPSDPKISSHTTQQKSLVLAQTWKMLHRQPNEDDDVEDDETRDLWEEKHFSGKEVRGAATDERKFPAWDVVDVSTLDERYRDGYGAHPPFWTVEVEELPRGSCVEWAAGLGIAGGEIKLVALTSKDGWSIHQCLTGATVISIIMLKYVSDISALTAKSKDALASIGIKAGTREVSFAAYIDVSIAGLWEQETVGGAVPCRSIWDSEGRRMSCVLLFNNL
ncbi:related to ATP-binding domain-containing protein 4 [Rhynchosporium secalis]|uniref:Diphthine--ammonia ligase n=1 Tax=Rhynchosporium secalis TaxID=38038 RepID=A0A1E1M0T5_RHYSE|nr:related to ATP-binding domain-containing protein 4 [Rhynchosporium secalis]